MGAPAVHSGWGSPSSGRSLGISGSPPLTLLSEPEQGVPPVTDSPEDLQTVATQLEHGHGPVGIDTERASGIRYGNRAFLVQLKREGAGIVLVDSEALPVLSSLNAALHGVEWILHAATQDLGCLAEKGMRPDALFDTELAARLLNFERFGLASLTEEIMGVTLAKEHSAVDWSTRPLPHEWLAYAALDVEVLGHLRTELADRLRSSGKWEYAQQEFDHLLSFTPPVHDEPWRRTHGLGRVKTARGLGRVRAMWALRDDLGEERDIAPSRILPDRAMIALAVESVKSERDVKRQFSRMDSEDAGEFFRVIKAADRLPDSFMPPVRNTPRVKRADRVTSKQRLEHMKPAIAQIAKELDMPHDLVVTPRYVKRLASLTTIGDEGDIADFLRDQGARPWQIELVTEPLAKAAHASGS